jgi:protein-tyrosine phosphatase
VILLGFLAKFLPEAKALLMEIFYAEIMSGGLKLINELAIDFAGREMVEVLKLFLKEENYPIAFYCTAGKDRTGLIAMLLLSVLGATDEEIVQDYQISDSVYRTSKSAGNAGLDLPEQQREEVEKEAEQINPFLRATPDIILHVLAYTRRLHGSIPKYLERNGFDKTAQNRLRSVP